MFKELFFVLYYTGSDMKEFLARIEEISHALRVAVEVLIHLLVWLTIWLIASLPFAVIYAALRKPLVSSFQFLIASTKRLHAHAREVRGQASSIKSLFLDNLAIRYVYDQNERRLMDELRQINRTATSVGGELKRSSELLMDKMQLLVREIGIVRQVDFTDAITFQGPDVQAVTKASSTRRTAAVTIAILIPLLISLIVVNTGMLTKFFDSLIDESVAGIKIAMIMGLLFSLIEIGLGITLYFISQNRREDSISGPLVMTLIVLLIAILASVEAFLYLLLSTDIARNLQAQNFSIPGLEGMEMLFAWWLAPFGAALVVSLSLLGHTLIDAVNRFVEAGHAKELKRVLEEAKRYSMDLDRVWVRVKQLAQDARGDLAGLESELSLNIANPSSIQQRLSKAADGVFSASASACDFRREPFSVVSSADASRTFDMYALFAVSFVVTIVVFCWLQIWFLQGVQIFSPLGWPVYLGVGLVEASAILGASYRMYPPITMRLDQMDHEPIRVGSEKFFSAFCVVVIFVVATFNLLLVIYSGSPNWPVLFLLSLACIVALCLFGRNLPYVVSTLRILFRILWSYVASVSLEVFALCVGALGVLTLALTYVFYMLAYPTIAVLWRSLSGDPIKSVEA